MTTKKKPVVCIPCNIIDTDGIPMHAVRDTYIRALTELADCLPLLIPAIGGKFDFSDIATKVDGVLLTGSPSHVAPSCYGAEQKFGNEELDLARDATTLPLIRQVLAMDKPMIAICRGFQELNVATGGTLHQKVHELSDKLDHRSRKELPLAERYRMQAHKVTSQKGGWFEKIGLPAEFPVNSLHQQGIDRLGKGLHVEALAEDGLVEAISLPQKRFVMALQWHPEGDFDINPTSKKILEAFGKALAG